MTQENVCVADGGLVNPAALIAKSADLDTTAITGAADDIRAMGTSVDTQTDGIKTKWNGLTGCYEAPEQAEVYALMNDPATASEDVKDTFEKMAGYLDTYAETLETIKPKLADFETRAQAFRDEVIDGVWVNATEASDAGVDDYAMAGLNWLAGNEQEKKKVPWYEDGDTVAKNTAFLEEVGGIYADVSAAAATCATSINGLTSLPPDKKTVPPIPKEAFYNPQQPMPWGSARDEDRNCPESVGHGAYQFGKNTVEGLGQLISYNPETGEWGDWDRAGQAWMGTGNVLLSLAVTGLGTVGFVQAMKASCNGDNAVVQWLDERHQVSATVVTGLVGIDLNADDPFHRWKEDGVATFTESFLNVGTMFIPVAGQAGTGVRVASIGSKLARITNTFADFAVPGGSWLVKGGMHAVPALRNILKFGDEVPINALDDVASVGARMPTFNPSALIDVVDDIPAVKPPERPVTDSLFGGGGAPPHPVDVDPTPTRTDSTTHSDTGSPRPQTPEPDGSPTRSPQPNQPVAATPDPQPARPTDTTPEPTSPTRPVDSTPEPTQSTQPADGTPGPETSHTQPDAADTADAPAAHTDQPSTETINPDDTPANTQPGQHDTHDTSQPSAQPDTQSAPDGGSTHDRHGREYTFDNDGQRHLPGDPDGTYRDRNGRLHDAETRQFTADDNKPGNPDLPVEKAEKGNPEDFTVSAADQAAHDARVQARDEALDAAHTSTERLDRLIASTGIDPTVLNGSTRTVTQRITDLVDQGTLSVKEGRSLTNALVHDRVSANALRSISERLGDKAAAAVARMRGETTLLGSGGAGSGRFDQVTVGGNPPTLKFYEAKGGTSQLGERTVDGVRTQQGTASYFNDVVQADPRLLDAVRQFMDRSPDSPITAGLKDGTIPIEYDLVQALPGGRIKVTPFVLDRSALKLPEFK